MPDANGLQVTDLAPMRGVIFGVLFSMPLWALGYGALMWAVGYVIALGLTR